MAPARATNMQRQQSASSQRSMGGATHNGSPASSSGGSSFTMSMSPAAMRRRISYGRKASFKNQRGPHEPLGVVQRFFDMPELVHLLCSYLEPERIDLISLASVSHHLRTIVLPFWAHHLDIALSQADKVLNLLAQYPTLLGYIRTIRIRSDGAESAFKVGRWQFRSNQGSSRAHKAPRWKELKLLLAMLAAQPTALLRAPAIDLTIGITEATDLVDAFDPFPRLFPGIVALRIVPDVNTDSDSQDEQDAYLEGWDFNWANMADFVKRIRNEIDDAAELAAEEEAEANIDGDHEAERFHIAGYADRLAESQKRGLLVFHFGHVDLEYDDYEWNPPAVPLYFWQALSRASASSLHDLSLTLARADLPDDIFPHLKHDQLRNFRLVRSASGPVEALEEFLNRNQVTMEDLTLDIGDPAEPLSLKQTFPRLRYCQIWAEDYISAATRRDRRIDFARRHPLLLGTAHRTITSGEPLFPNRTFSKLRVLNSISMAYGEHARQGGRIALLRTGLDLDSIASESWLARMPEAARAVTGLELKFRHESIKTLTPQLGALSARLLPNLAELSLMYPNEVEFDFFGVSGGRVEQLDEKGLGRVLRALIPATSLRVLRLHDEHATMFGPDSDGNGQLCSALGSMSLSGGNPRADGDVFGFDSEYDQDGSEDAHGHGLQGSRRRHELEAQRARADILVDFDGFPPSLQYVGWFVAELNDSMWYRFVPSAKSSTQSAQGQTGQPTPTQAKRGRLQRIPTRFRTRVSSEGVWESLADVVRSATVFDHGDGSPGLPL